MGIDVLSGDIYIFLSRHRNAIKLLSFEGDGFANILHINVWNRVHSNYLPMIPHNALLLSMISS